MTSEFAVRWDQPVLGLSDYSPAVATVVEARKILAGSAYTGRIVQREVTELEMP